MKQFAKTVLVSFIASFGLASAVSVLAAKSGILAQPPVINLDAPGIEVSLHTEIALREVLRDPCYDEEGNEYHPVDTVAVELQDREYLENPDNEEPFTDLGYRLLADGLGHMIIRLDGTGFLTEVDDLPATGPAEFWFSGVRDLNRNCVADDEDVVFGHTVNVRIQ